MATKDRIYQGDTFPVKYECRKPNLEDTRDSRGLPATPISASIRVYDSINSAFLELGGPGVYDVDAEITAATGTDAGDLGAMVTYTLPATFTQVSGDYTLFLTAEFADSPTNVILTENRRYKVEEYR